MQVHFAVSFIFGINHKIWIGDFYFYVSSLKIWIDCNYAILDFVRYINLWKLVISNNWSINFLAKHLKTFGIIKKYLFHPIYKITFLSQWVNIPYKSFLFVSSVLTQFYFFCLIRNQTCSTHFPWIVYVSVPQLLRPCLVQLGVKHPNLFQEV